MEAVTVTESAATPSRGLAHWADYARLMRLDKPIGIFLLLWPTLWALWIAADGLPDLDILWVFVAGVVVMRSAGCVINDYADRDIDAKVRRTHNRPIAAGRVSPREALILFVVLCLIALTLVMQLNLLSMMISLAAVLLAASYPFAKRVTHLPQVHLGVAFAMATPMAFAAIRNDVPLLAWILFFITVVWAVAYDTMYAMVDRDEDVAIGVKSTAVLFGRQDRAIIAMLQATVLTGFVILWMLTSLGVQFVLGVCGAALLFLYQQWLIRRRDPGGCFHAFLNNNWVGFIVFAGLVADLI
ncbi:MAG TPA: 4-hydroxybenzoate octaprenyltransferase [Chromatiaceae bacterium]|nr:4-hydroxybenzoate octaprenyltransferase [Chromatiaceae bacterium]HIB83084.1 4-hydroxybenzoate octaprenyltransferase [Chromatiaceae bacterium]HIN83192.1 4-hydroxybenzoate octaprenyltransferase [Chromatiales bacterium]HIO53613.1 4-hydroxybenzoate octaprenyltransferase [Chromatiales bacterium]